MQQPQATNARRLAAPPKGDKPACMSACVGKERTRDMFATLAVFHALMSSLNVGLLANTEAMLVTAAVFQPPMLPYVVVAALGLVIHAVTAVPMLASVMRQVTEAHVGYAACSVDPHAL